MSILKERSYYMHTYTNL